MRYKRYQPPIRSPGYTIPLLTTMLQSLDAQFISTARVLAYGDTCKDIQLAISRAPGTRSSRPRNIFSAENAGFYVQLYRHSCFLCTIDRNRSVCDGVVHAAQVFEQGHSWWLGWSVLGISVELPQVPTHFFPLRCRFLLPMHIRPARDAYD